MKRISPCIAVVFALLAHSLYAAEPSATHGRVGLLVIGELDTTLVDRTAAFLARQYQTEVVKRGVIKEMPKKSSAIRVLVKAKAEAGDLCVVALVNYPGSSGQGAVFPEDRCAIVNAAALALGLGDSPDIEIYARRLEKETLRAVATLMGIPECPFPRCGLRAHSSDTELDFKSRNPCPPCLEKVRAKIKAQASPKD